MKKLFLLLVAVISVTLCASAQTRTVTGTVLEEGSEEPIIGASVVAGNNTMGVSTDVDGNFAIQVPANVNTLKVSHVGMQTKTVKITANNLKIYLSTTAESLNTVIVTAYGTTTKGAYTGSAGVVSAAQLENVQVANVSNALNGKIAGVQTISSNGQPGVGSKIRIRGVGSINAETEPLYVVDGMPFEGDIATIPTQDIESITVQKDAASTALYGARGANGVVQVTTKRGAEGAAVVNLDMKWGSNSRAIPNYDIITDQRQYLETVYQTLVGSGRYTYGVPEDQLNAWANARLWSSIGYQTWTIPDGELAIGHNGKFNPNATPGYKKGNYWFLGDDWSKESLIHGLRQEYNLSVSGGTERLKYYVSASYLGDEGIIKNSHYNRFSTRASVDYQAKPWLKIGTNISYTYQNSAYPGDQTLDESSSTGNAFNIANNLSSVYPFWIRLADTKQIAYNSTYGKPIYDYGEGADYGWGPTGMKRNIYGQSNPIGALTYDTSDVLADVFNAKWYAVLTPFKGFSLTGNAGYYVDNTRGHYIQNGVYGQFKQAGGYVQQEYARSREINLQLLAQYDWTIAQRHNFSVMAGFENSAFRTEVLYGTGSNLYNPTWPFLDNIIDDKQNGGYERSLVHRGFLGRLRYDFDGKYFVNASIRRDGSSRFSKDHRWGTFWSASAGWNINKEAFMQEYSDIIDILKFKFSFGENGNDGIGKYYLAYADQYTIGGGNGVWNDATLYYKGNPDVTWEKSAAINTGFDFSFKKGLVSGSIEYYQRTVSDMLFNLPVAPSLGYSSMPYNVGKMRNAGFEFDFNVRPIATKNITLDLNANLTLGWNRVLKLDPSIMNTTSNWRMDSKKGWLTSNRFFEEGKSMYNLWLVEYAGVNENGMPTWYALRDKLDDEGNKIPYLYNYDANGNIVPEVDENEQPVLDADGNPVPSVKQYVQEEYATTVYSDAYNTNRKATGNIMPKGYGGFGFNLDIYGFDISTSFAYQFGGKILDYGYQNFTGSYAKSNIGLNMHKDLLNAWTPEKHTNVPRLEAEANSSAASTSTRYLISSNYVSLNNVTVGYTLPKSLLAKLHLGTVRVYFAAENVALWSKRKGLDPRQGYVSSENSTYSPIRSLSGGIKVSF